jgi:hypothetical protein
MHPTLKDLISVRDGEPADADVAGHVVGCEQCSAALAELSELRRELRWLPDYEPPSHSWPDIEQQLRSRALAPRRSSGWRATGWRAGTAAAAAVGLGALAFMLLIGPIMHGSSPDTDSSESHRSNDTALAPEPVAALVARSQQLEAILSGLPRPGVERAATSAAIDELQARIEVLDLQLSSADESGLSGPQARQLWSQRVQLLDSLVSVRYAEQAARGNNWPSIATGDI